ncbi:hypothetical protein J4E90_005243 [Alternaria incomplexa]|uniref:uncharacterized protein n=1 Tax=Alternaria incomplexa TaxID=1187928 RepID=UPI00221F8B04|nr:uncharacterized protein J4E90_005243 [Alternaria incomplexa]XP_051307860.1 uncharacterized protein J4E86_001119 [Alternaria arbusti]KAI4913526.1 hypothetical protein J4E90_005243 [Alternaria incomplexa]KAI4962087.1 hypothetical protein J4E86_001119 [Alternaria arbusti]
MPHATATVNGILVAETDSYEVVDGNIYFPPDTIKSNHFSPTSTKTHCPYKGDASYYTVTANKTEVKDAAWYYPEPLESMNNIKGYVAFYKGKAEVKSE